MTGVPPARRHFTLGRPSLEIKLFFHYHGVMQLHAGFVLGLVFLGLTVGMISGMIGIGGGVLVIPLLMMFFGFNQLKANGTSLAMLLPPIGIMGVLAYHRAGQVEWRVALVLAAGYSVGVLLGAVVVNRGWVNQTALRLTFALFLIYVGANLLFRPGGRARVALEVSVMVTASALLYVGFRLLGKRYHRSPGLGQLYDQRLKHGGGVDYQI